MSEPYIFKFEKCNICDCVLEGNTILRFTLDGYQYHFTIKKIRSVLIEILKLQAVDKTPIMKKNVDILATAYKMMKKHKEGNNQESQKIHTYSHEGQEHENNELQEPQEEGEQVRIDSKN